MSRRKIIFICAGLVIIVAISFLVHKQTSDSRSTTLVNPDVLARLPKESRSSAHTARLGSGIIPPTNSWISGMVLQKVPNPVYPMPYSVKATSSGFEMGLPQVSSTATEINGSHTPSLVADLGATDFSLTHFDGIVAKLQYQTSGKPVADVTLASGSPYMFVRSLTDNTITLPAITDARDNSRAYLRFAKDGKQYVIVARNGASITMNGASAAITTKKGGLVTLYALPDRTPDVLLSYAGNEITSASISYKNESASAVTTINYATKNNQPTVFAAMAYHDVKGMQQLMSYGSIFGQMPVYKGMSFTLSVPLVTASNSLDLQKLSAEHRRSLVATLRDDVEATQFTAKDSYFAGKQLARAANLLDIAYQLKQDDIARELQQRLTAAFADRLNNNYFYYDTTLHGIAASTAAFGSEDFNDHHFHYGYFLYAASILGRYDPQFVANHGEYINLLAADIANPTADEHFPTRRNFDPYASHSWAAGLAPFADGNNQESSSEAIQAWNGVALWGDLIKNQELSSSGRWMLAQESATAAKAWRHVDTSDAALKSYSSPLTSLNFGGKRTYATFFSDEPNTKLAIQLLPLNPAMTTFKKDGDNIPSQVTAATRNNFNVTLGDYILMYSALYDPVRAIKALPLQQKSFIDDGNSRTYMNAWVYYQSDTR